MCAPAVTIKWISIATCEKRHGPGIEARAHPLLKAERLVEAGLCYEHSNTRRTLKRSNMGVPVSDEP